MNMQVKRWNERPALLNTRIVYAYTHAKVSGTVFMSRGKALDAAFGDRSLVRRTTIRLYPNESIPDDAAMVYRMTYTDASGAKVYSDNFLSANGLLRYAEKLEGHRPDGMRIYNSTLNVQHYPKPVKNRTYDVDFRFDDHHRLYCTIVTDPDYYGTYGRGKRYFPDSSWVDAKAGEATVSIVSDNTTYGYVVGRMKDYTIPDLVLVDILDALDEHLDVYANNVLSYVESKSHGNYYVTLAYRKQNRYADIDIMERIIGVDRWANDCVDHADLNTKPLGGYTIGDVYSNTVWTYPVQTVLLADSWGIDPADGTSMENVRKIIQKFDSDHIVKNLMRYSNGWMLSGLPKGINGLLAEAWDEGIFDIRNFIGTDITIFVPAHAGIVNYGKFTMEDAAEIIRLANAHNVETHNRIKGMIKHGKLSASLFADKGVGV